MIQATPHQIQKPTKTKGQPVKAWITPFAPGGPLCLIEYSPAREIEVANSEATMSSMQVEVDVSKVVDRSACLPKLRSYLGTDDLNQSINALDDLVKKASLKKGGFCTHTRTIPAPLYHTHSLHGISYMLSEVGTRGITPLESQFCADLGHPSDLSHTPTRSLFLAPIVTVVNKVIITMKNQLKPRAWRGYQGRLWRLADHFGRCAEEIRYANKPSDLFFPIYRILDLIRQTREQQYEWLEKLLKLNPIDRGRWPHL